jgi:hypothetical protein
MPKSTQGVFKDHNNKVASTFKVTLSSFNVHVFYKGSERIERRT